MNRYKIIFSILIVFILSFSLHAQTNDAIKLRASIFNNKIKDSNYLGVALRFTTIDTSIEVSFRGCLKWGYEQKWTDNDMEDVLVDLQKIGKKKYSNYRKRTQVYAHTNTCYDSLGNELFDTLRVGKDIYHEENIAPFYNFIQGNYRVRVKAYGKISNKQTLILYSNWVYFKIKVPRTDW